eukprot:48742-Eustigmatos_ZCMA.PRE.1
MAAWAGAHDDSHQRLFVDILTDCPERRCTDSSLTKTREGPRCPERARLHFLPQGHLPHGALRLEP